MKPLLYICLLLACGVAQAAKVPVSWKNPTHNVDGTVLTDLSHIIIEWGSCNGVEFGVMQSSRLIATSEAGAELNSYVYPTGLSRVCVRAMAFNMQGANSAYTTTDFKDLLPSPGKPVTLGQPVILSFNRR